jgi:hypothetical protein
VDGRSPGAAYLVAHKELLVLLTNGRAHAPRRAASAAGARRATFAHAASRRSFERVETALITGSMLREAIKAESLCQCAGRGRLCTAQVLSAALAPRCRYLVNSPSLYDLLAYTDVPTFEVASDAFLTFKELLGRHPGVTGAFLLAQSAPFFAAYNGKLLASQNYVTRRQSIKARKRGARELGRQLIAAFPFPPDAAPGRAASDAGKRGADDAIHRRRGAFEADHEPAARPQPLHPV